MRLLICLVTHNRLEYTKKTFHNLRDTLDDISYLVVYDNGSTDGTVEWLERMKVEDKINILICNPENKYPGYACNTAWELGLQAHNDVTHLMRLDNDMELKPGWYERAQAYFKAFPNLGQLGLDYGPQEAYPEQSHQPSSIIESNGEIISTWPGNVGGTCIIPRKIWDEGLRYDETPWPEAENPTIQEDHKLSQDVKNMGYLFGHATDHLANTADDPKDYPDYYRKTWTERNYNHLLGTLDDIDTTTDS